MQAAAAVICDPCSPDLPSPAKKGLSHGAGYTTAPDACRTPSHAADPAHRHPHADMALCAALQVPLPALASQAPLAPLRPPAPLEEEALAARPLQRLPASLLALVVVLLLAALVAAVALAPWAVACRRLRPSRRLARPTCGRCASRVRPGISVCHSVAAW